MAISLNDAAHLIAANGANKTYILRGEPGIGKSAILKMMAAAMPEYVASYIDAATLSLGDLALPVFKDINGQTVTEFAPNARFGFQFSKPMIIMVDEIGKGSQEVRNMLLPILYEHRFGNTNLHPGSITFGTSNLLTDGLGDSMKAHERNRFGELTIRKPTADEWLKWAANNNIAAEVMSFVSLFSHCMESYTDFANGKTTNPYIYDPKNANQRAFVSPRSLELASFDVKNRDKYSTEALHEALKGTIGEAAATDMTNLVGISDQLPSRDKIFADPHRTTVPKDTSAMLILVFTLANNVNTDAQLEAAIDYLNRAPSEYYTLFLRQIEARTQVFAKVASRNKKFMVEYQKRAKIM